MEFKGHFEGNGEKLRDKHRRALKSTSRILEIFNIGL